MAEKPINGSTIIGGGSEYTLSETRDILVGSLNYALSMRSQVERILLIKEAKEFGLKHGVTQDEISEIFKQVINGRDKEEQWVK